MGQRIRHRQRLLPRLIAARLILCCSGFWCAVSGWAVSEIRELCVAADGREYDLNYNTDMLPSSPVSLERDALIAFYQKISESCYQPFVETIGSHGANRQLDDWRLYRLVCASTAAMLPQTWKSEQILLIWFVMTQLGFDTRLAFNQDHPTLFIYSEEELFEVPAIVDNYRSYYHFPYPGMTSISAGNSYLLEFTPKSGGKPLSFDRLERGLPAGATRRKTITFQYREERLALELEYDSYWVALLGELPLRSETSYFDFPMSEALAESLWPQWDSILKGRDSRTKLEILLAFTRNAFDYQEDRQQFEREKPLLPDEIFHYPYSDCEDRAILFFHLARRYLPWPLAVISFENHISIAVALPEDCEEPVIFNGISYCVCDPTGPKDTQEAGSRPEPYKNQTPELVKIWP